MSRAASATFDAGNGMKIHRIPLQAFPNFWANVYVIQGNEQCILIDTGSGTDTSHEDLLGGLRQAGLETQDLTHILLTHAHIDHYGGLTKLRPLTAAKIGCHELDSQSVAHHETTVAIRSRRLASYLTETGLGKEGADSLLSIYGFTKALYQSVPVDFTYNEINNHITELEWIHLPGHCSGHVALKLDDIVFCGDMVVEGVTPHLMPETVSPHNGLDHYLDSLERFRSWAKGAHLILNGHDEVITDLPAQIDATQQNIVRRMSKAVEALSVPRTISDVCNKVYGSPGGYNLLLTIEKTGAYIEYLHQHGMIEIVNAAEVQQGLPVLYRRLNEMSDSEILPKERKHVLI